MFVDMLNIDQRMREIIPNGLIIYKFSNYIKYTVE